MLGPTYAIVTTMVDTNSTTSNQAKILSGSLKAIVDTSHNLSQQTRSPNKTIAL